MKIKIFPKYTPKGPSSRYRIYQYLPYLTNYDIEIFPFFDDNYNPAMSFKTVNGFFYACKCYIKRLLNILKIKSKDIVFIQYEFTQFLPFNALFFKLFKIRYIVDYDDAAFHDYDQNSNIIIRKILKTKIAIVIKNAKYVITGSPYLTEYALKFNSNVIEIPTSIDIDKYRIEKSQEENSFTIGWIGSTTTSIHIEIITKALEVLKNRNVDFKLNLIGYHNEKINLHGLPVNIIKWMPETEIAELNKFDVGIMPMIDLPFVRGKCAFKLIQYMAMAKPTISSRFDANLKVDRNNENLFADNTEEWVYAFEKLIANKTKAKEIGARNREVIEREYSIQVNKNKLINIIELVSLNKV